MDRRIGELARNMTAGATTDLERARAIEHHMRTAYGYTSNSQIGEVSSPLAYDV